MDADALPVRINYCGFFRSNRFWRLGPERTRAWVDLNLMLLLDGAGSLVTPEGIVRLAPGTCVLLRGGESYEFRPEPRPRLEHWYVHFDYLRPGGQAVPTASTALPPRHRRIDDHRLLSDLLSRTVAASRQRAGPGQAGGDPRLPPGQESLEAERWFSTALMEVARFDRGARPKHPRAVAIDELCAQVRAEPGVAWRIENWARDLELSPDGARVALIPEGPYVLAKAMATA